MLTSDRVMIRIKHQLKTSADFILLFSILCDLNMSHNYSQSHLSLFYFCQQHLERSGTYYWTPSVLVSLSLAQDYSNRGNIIIEARSCCGVRNTASQHFYNKLLYYINRCYFYSFRQRCEFECAVCESLIYQISSNPSRVFSKFVPTYFLIKSTKHKLNGSSQIYRSTISTFQ